MLRTQFTPRNIGSLRMWLDASVSSSLFDATTGGSRPANNGGVGRWEDLSGNGFHVTQGTANNRPQRKTQQLNGLDGIYFDGSNDCLYCAANVFDTTVSVLCVAAFDNNTSRRAVFDLNTQDGIQYRNFALEQNTYKTAGNRYGFYATQNALDADLETSSGAKLLCLTANATTNNNVINNTTYRINGVSRTLGVREGTGNYKDCSATNGVMVGAFNNAGVNASPTIGMLGHIYEVIVYNVRLSTEQIGVIERYLARKWGITL